MSFLEAWQREVVGGGWVTVVSTLVDILLVAAVVYWLIMLSKRTRAWKIVWGLVIFLLLVFLTDRLGLRTLNYLLRSFLPLGPVAIVILFYPELRHALENMGKFAGWGTRFALLEKEDAAPIIPVIVKAACEMSKRQIGALIVIEREDALEDIASTGTRLDAAATEELILSIFNPGAPLHDGAILIRGNRVVAAGCTLPLSETTQLGTMIHTRHKAALGVTEESDAVVVVVSEETGTISLAVEGRLHRGLNEHSLTDALTQLLGSAEKRPRGAWLASTLDNTLRKAKLRQK
ncbi:MAG: diadenylate cyclase CdaA [Armatimonadota bacterium]|nr:diadenylate cyclase CdaA [Armatimonadota bacterium]